MPALLQMLLNRRVDASRRILGRRTHKLGMLRQRHRRPRPIQRQPVDANRDKCKAPAHLFRRCHNLQLVADDGRAQIAEVHVDAGARRVAQVPRGNGHARRHVDNGGGDGAVQAPATVDVRGIEHQAAEHAALRGRVQRQRRQDGAVDGAAPLEGVEDGLDVLRPDGVRDDRAGPCRSERLCFRSGHGRDIFLCWKWLFVFLFSAMACDV